MFKHLSYKANQLCLAILLKVLLVTSLPAKANTDALQICPDSLGTSSEQSKNGIGDPIFKIARGEIPDDFFAYIQGVVLQVLEKSKRVFPLSSTVVILGDAAMLRTHPFQAIQERGKAMGWTCNLGENFIKGSFAPHFVKTLNGDYSSIEDMVKFSAAHEIGHLVFDSILLAAIPALKMQLEELNSIKQEQNLRMSQKRPSWSDESKTYSEIAKLENAWYQRAEDLDRLEKAHELELNRILVYVQYYAEAFADFYALLLGSSHEIYVGMRTKKNDPVHTLFYPTIKDVASKHNLDLILDQPSLLEKIGQAFIEEIRWFRSRPIREPSDEELNRRLAEQLKGSFI